VRARRQDETGPYSPASPAAKTVPRAAAVTLLPANPNALQTAEAVLSIRPAAFEATKLKRALIVWGGWERHQPKACVDRFVPSLERAGFDVSLFGTLEVYEDKDLLRSSDLVVQCWTMGEITKARSGALSEAVAAGTGLAGWHGGLCDSFRASPDYQLLTGGQWVAHPDGQVEYAVDIVPAAAEDPIVAGLGRFRVHTEQYYMHVDPGNEVLATTTFGAHAEAPAVEGVVMPVAWKRRWGKGRVFYCSIGHSPSDFDVPEAMTIMERGMLWASR
jgi:uncharacterized protein